MKTKLPISLLVFATMMSTACEKQKFNFELADNIDGLNQTDPGAEGDPRRGR